MNYFGAYAIHPPTYLPIDSSPLLCSSLNWHPPPLLPTQASGINEKFQCSPPTLTSFLRPLETFRHWHHFYDGSEARWRRVGSKVPPSISSRTVTDQKGGISRRQNIPLIEQIARKNVINVKGMIKLSGIHLNFIEDYQTTNVEDWSTHFNNFVICFPRHFLFLKTDFSSELQMYFVRCKCGASQETRRYFT